MVTTLFPQLPPAWLSQPAEVRAHLRAAATQIGLFEIEVQGRNICVMLQARQVQRQTLSVRPISPMPPEALPRRGQTVQVRYGDALSRCTFLTQIAETSPDGGWTLSLPTAIERRERRVAPRFSVAGMGVVLRVSEPGADILGVEAIDLSALGLAFRCHTAHETGTQLLASLWLDTEAEPLCPHLEVRSCRPVAGSPGVFIHGCEMTGLTPSEYDRLDLALMRLRRSA